MKQNKRVTGFALILFPVTFFLLSWTSNEKVYIRINQVGYLPEETKVGIVFSNRGLSGNFRIQDASLNATVYTGKLEKATPSGWGNYKYYYEADFTGFEKTGEYVLQIDGTSAESMEFSIGKDIYNGYQEDILGFMRQQRCGYNPFFGVACHRLDGRTMYGWLPDSSFLDLSGGWHDAGDQLKYLITSSFATGFMLLTYELEPGKFDDLTDDLGRPLPNGIPDVLDEARWGMDWLHKLYAYPETLIHQIADDRDHVGWKYPHKDPSDYGWGPDSYRVAYVATGEPQGLGEYKSKATGLANLAGRTAAAMAIGYRVWRNIDPPYAELCQRKAISLYEYGKKNEGFQQGNSYGAPYRYNETTWSDDMEWAAAELYRNTGQESYLEDALRYAESINTESWMEYDTTAHYKLYPFVNIGHYALYSQVDNQQKDKLASYYRSGIEKIQERSSRNPFMVGTPFIWCSNNIIAALITQIILYEKMTGDRSYHDVMVAHRDWLFGTNPWSTSMFMNIPRDGEYPEDVHTSVYALTGVEVPGGLIDGPIYASIYNRLLGLELTEEDEFEAFQNDIVVYHDDIGDYSTNEPTMDGTASTLLMFVTLNSD